MTAEAPKAGYDGKVFDLDADRKAWTTLAARFALRGYTARRSNPADGEQRFFVGRWGHTREFVDLVSVERFLRGIGGPNA